MASKIVILGLAALLAGCSQPTTSPDLDPKFAQKCHAAGGYVEYRGAPSHLCYHVHTGIEIKIQ